MTYRVRTAVSTEVGGKSNSSAETEQHAQTIHDHVHDGYGEFVDESRGEEVKQCKQPPDTNKQCVVDDRVCAVGCARNVITSHGCDDYSAEELHMC